MATQEFSEIVQYEYPAMTGLNLSVASNTTLTITDGTWRDPVNGLDVTVNTGGVGTTINCATTGLNGLDTGSLAASTVYAVHAIGDATGFHTPGFLVSTSITAPLLPYGYGIFKRIGWAVTSSGSVFLIMYQQGGSETRIYTYDTKQIVLSAGTATSLTSVNCTGVLPPLNKLAYLNGVFTPNAASDTASYAVSGSTATTIFDQVGQVSSVAISDAFQLPIVLSSGNPAFQYKLSTASAHLTVYVLGFADYL